MWEMWNRGSSPEGSVGSFTNTSLRKIGCKRQRPPYCKGSFLLGRAAEVGSLPSCTCDTAGVFSRRRLCPSPMSPAVLSPVKSHKCQYGLARHRNSKWEEGSCASPVSAAESRWTGSHKALCCFWLWITSHCEETSWDPDSWWQS